MDAFADLGNDFTTKFTIAKAKPNRVFYSQTINQTWLSEAQNGGFPVYLYYEFDDLVGVPQNEQDNAIMHDEVYKYGFTWHPENDDK